MQNTTVKNYDEVISKLNDLAEQRTKIVAAITAAQNDLAAAREKESVLVSGAADLEAAAIMSGAAVPAAQHRKELASVREEVALLDGRVAGFQRLMTTLEDELLAAHSRFQGIDRVWQSELIAASASELKQAVEAFRPAVLRLQAVAFATNSRLLHEVLAGIMIPDPSYPTRSILRPLQRTEVDGIRTHTRYAVFEDDQAGPYLNSLTAKRKSVAQILEVAERVKTTRANQAPVAPPPPAAEDHMRTFSHP